MLQSLKKSNQYIARTCVGKLDATYNELQVLHLGQCKGTSLKSDCTAAVLDGPDLIAYYSSGKQHPLFDIIYKVGAVYHAFKVTKGKSHEAKQRMINILVNRLQIGSCGRELRLYYAVHEGVFDNFVTDPTAPAATINGVSIYHLKLVQGLLA